MRNRFLSALLSNSRLGYGLEQLRENDGISLRRLPWVILAFVWVLLAFYVGGLGL